MSTITAETSALEAAVRDMFTHLFGPAADPAAITHVALPDFGQPWADPDRVGFVVEPPASAGLGRRVLVGASRAPGLRPTPAAVVATADQLLAADRLPFLDPTRTILRVWDDWVLVARLDAEDARLGVVSAQDRATAIVEHLRGGWAASTGPLWGERTDEVATRLAQAAGALAPDSYNDVGIRVLHSGLLDDGRRAMTLNYILWDDRYVDWTCAIAIVEAPGTGATVAADDRAVVDGWAVARTAKREGAAMEMARALRPGGG